MHFTELSLLGSLGSLEFLLWLFHLIPVLESHPELVVVLAVVELAEVVGGGDCGGVLCYGAQGRVGEMFWWVVFSCSNLAWVTRLFVGLFVGCC